MNRTTFVKICITDKDRFLSTKLKNEGKDGFDLTLWDRENIWNGQLTEDDLDSLCARLKIDFNSYVDQTAKAFTHENMGDISFQYSLKKCPGNQIEFIWKKLVPSEEIKFQLGSVKLSREDDTTKATEKIFTYCINSITELNSQIKSLETDNERLSQERTNALKRLDKCVTAKEEMEKDLYSKFVSVLNSKKQKIKELKENGYQPIKESPSKDVDVQSDDESVHGKTEITPEHSDYEENTDDEAPASKRARKGPKRKDVKNDSGDTSLLLDDGMEETEPTFVPRPQRRKGGNKKQTPSKPVLPKVPSGGSSSSGETKRSVIRKSTSAGNRSTAEIDAEDLFADL